MKTMPLSLGNIILLKEKGGMRESIPRQVVKKSRGPQGEKGLEFLIKREGQTVCVGFFFFFFFNPLHSLVLVQETRVRSLGQEDPLEKEMATHSSTLA